MPSVAGSGWLPAGERDDFAASAGAHIAELLVFQCELVDYTDEGRDVGTELGELLFLGGDRSPEPGDVGAEPDLVTVLYTVFPDAQVELVLQISVALG